MDPLNVEPGDLAAGDIITANIRVTGVVTRVGGVHSKGGPLIALNVGQRGERAVFLDELVILDHQSAAGDEEPEPTDD